MESGSRIPKSYVQRDDYKHTVSGKALHLQSRFDSSSRFLAERSCLAPVRPGERRLQPGCWLHRRDPLKGE